MTSKKSGGLVMLLGIGGILLIFISEVLSGGVHKAASVPKVTDEMMQQYVSDTECRLTELLNTVEGVGALKVMLTLENGTDYLYATTEKSTSSANPGTAATQASYENDYVIVDGQKGKEALIETYHMPEIRGVAVICEGGDDISTVKRVTELVSVVFGLSTNRICVTKMT
ncbi:MAG: hypothetical protein RR075_04050 [Pygmaiobacter sp.]